MIFRYLRDLILYAEEAGFADPADRPYHINALLDALRLTVYEDPGDAPRETDLPTILAALTDHAVSNGIIEDGITARDLFDTRLMGLLTPRPSEIIKRFRSLYRKAPQKATDWFYRFCGDCHYIRRERVEKDLKWTAASAYGDLVITINLSKPEKDPKAIAAARKQTATGYPKCSLCRENEGYAGRYDAPARQNHRVIPLTLNGEPWFFQYSPYVYYNEHCIVLNAKHTPMAITRNTFVRLLDFVTQFPHYFIGSNADLPIVGGSILTHDHFQGGRFDFPMAKSQVETKLSFTGYPDVEGGIVSWPMSVIRLISVNKESLISLSDGILAAWRGYSDESVFLYAETDNEKHNTITPIARFRNGRYELDLVLRNNIRTEEHPLGVFHPHAELHHIKKENIGLIEVMGLAVLPSRLKNEMEALSEKLTAGAGKNELLSDPLTEKHADWALSLQERYGTPDRDSVREILRREIGAVFTRVLEDAGVYKRDEQGKKAFLRFMKTIGAELV